MLFSILTWRPNLIRSTYPGYFSLCLLNKIHAFFYPNLTTLLNKIPDIFLIPSQQQLQLKEQLHQLQSHLQLKEQQTASCKRQDLPPVAAAFPWLCEPYSCKHRDLQDIIFKLFKEFFVAFVFVFELFKKVFLTFQEHLQKVLTNNSPEETCNFS